MDETLIRAQQRELTRTGRYYRHVCWMAVPLLCMSCYFYGPLLLCGAAVITGNLCDRLVSLLRRRVYQPNDFSSESFALLIALLMPATVDWYVLIAAVLAGVFIGKEVFGGTGMNVFNPALLARAFAFFAYTPSMSGETVWYSDWTMMGAQVDGITGATALEQLGTTGAMNYSPLDAFLGFIPGSFAETSTLAILLGGAILLFTGIASWRTMASVFVGGLAMGYLFQALGVTTYPAWYHLIVGGFAFGAVFMATDYSTSPMTVRGGVIYAVGIGVITMCIRLWGAYPEGMSFAILIMNACVPLINKYVKPKRFGVK